VALRSKTAQIRTFLAAGRGRGFLCATNRTQKKMGSAAPPRVLFWPRLAPWTLGLGLGPHPWALGLGLGPWAFAWAWAYLGRAFFVPCTMAQWRVARRAGRRFFLTPLNPTLRWVYVFICFLNPLPTIPDARARNPNSQQIFFCACCLLSRHFYFYPRVAVVPTIRTIFSLTRLVVADT
jgi:hypothetical protein